MRAVADQYGMEPCNGPDASSSGRYPACRVPGKTPLSPSCYCKPSRGMSSTFKERSEDDLSIRDDALLAKPNDTVFSHVSQALPRLAPADCRKYWFASSSRSR